MCLMLQEPLQSLKKSNEDPQRSSWRSLKIFEKIHQSGPLCPLTLTKRFDACTKVGLTSKATSASCGLSPSWASALRLWVSIFKLPPVKSFPSNSEAANSFAWSLWSVVVADCTGPMSSMEWVNSISTKSKGGKTVQTVTVISLKYNMSQLQCLQRPNFTGPHHVERASMVSVLFFWFRDPRVHLSGVIVSSSLIRYCLFVSPHPEVKCSPKVASKTWQKKSANGLD